MMETDSPSAILHILEHHPKRIECLWVNPKNPRLNNVLSLARAKKVPVDTSFSGAQTVKARLASFKYTQWKDLLIALESKPRAVILALDHLQDPQNLGALCRSAEAFGVSGILLPKDRSVRVTEGVYSASVGTVESVPIAQVANIKEAIKQAKEKGFWVIGASARKSDHALSEIQKFEKVIIVLGAEWEGTSDKLSIECDLSVHIPILGKVESLNVSVAGALLMYECVRALPH